MRSEHNSLNVRLHVVTTQIHTSTNHKKKKKSALNTLVSRVVYSESYAVHLQMSGPETVPRLRKSPGEWTVSFHKVNFHS